MACELRLFINIFMGKDHMGGGGEKKKCGRNSKTCGRHDELPYMV